MVQRILQKAKQAKKDEFYTQSKDIEDELKHYKSQFRDKVVYCNCDDPFESNFFRYFVLNFKALGLRQLITTSYKPSPIDETQLALSGIADPITQPAKGRPKTEAKRFIINDVGDLDGNGAFNLTDVAEQLKANKNNEWATLVGDGDFRSDECITLLDQADIVVTNPPFSLFREYLAQLVEHNKKFLIIGNKNAITYKEVFKLIKDDKLWLGYRNINSDMWFEVPEGHSYEKIVDDKKIKHIMACWFTNLDTTKRHEEFVMYRKYSPELYPRYDNFDGINIDVVADIPMDYDGVMGVPITYLDKYNPEQFEVLYLGNLNGFPVTKQYQNPVVHKDGKITPNSMINAVLTIRTDNVPAKAYYTADDFEGYLIAPYARILIKNKKVAK